MQRLFQSALAAFTMILSALGFRKLCLKSAPILSRKLFSSSIFPAIGNPSQASELLTKYKEQHAKSIHPQESEEFWRERAENLLTWKTPFTAVCEGDFVSGRVKWFEGGKLNAYDNCVARHLSHRAEKV